jgi:hypothetical protein
MPRKYTGNTDGVSPSGARPGTKKLVALCQRRWAFTNLGIFANRPMRGSKQLSVHATGRACDVGYPKTRAGRAAAREAWDWFLANSEALGIEEVHDYAYLNPKQDPSDKTAWGRGYRCSRGEGIEPKSVKLFTRSENAGTPNGAWLHIELSPEMADDAEAFEKAWRAIPKP